MYDYLWILLIISASIWQIGFAYKIFYKRPIQYNIENGTNKTVESNQIQPIQKSIGAVEVQVEKKVKVENVETSMLTSDETIKGKVKTKKDQLRALRNG